MIILAGYGTLILKGVDGHLMSMPVDTLREPIDSNLKIGGPDGLEILGHGSSA